MSFSPYPLLKANAGVVALLGASPRAYPFGAAPQPPQPPYITWQVVAGAPENYLSERPDIEYRRLQFDCWGLELADAQAIAAAAVTALELSGHQVSINGDDRDPDTLLYRTSFDFGFWVDL